jgi:hypothetical protein
VIKYGDVWKQRLEIVREAAPAAADFPHRRARRSRSEVAKQARIRQQACDTKNRSVSSL